MAPKRPCCPECGSLLEEVEEALRTRDETIYQLGVRIGKLEAQNTALRGQQNRVAEADPLYPDAELVFEYWKATLSPNAREFTKDRQVAVLARLKAGFSVEELCQAVDGCASSEWHREHGHRKLTQICSPEDRTLRFIEIAAEHGLARNGHGPDPALIRIKAEIILALMPEDDRYLHERIEEAVATARAEMT